MRRFLFWQFLDLFAKIPHSDSDMEEEVIEAEQMLAAVETRLATSLASASLQHAPVLLRKTAVTYEKSIPPRFEENLRCLKQLRAEEEAKKQAQYDEWWRMRLVAIKQKDAALQKLPTSALTSPSSAALTTASSLPSSNFVSNVRQLVAERKKAVDAAEVYHHHYEPSKYDLISSKLHMAVITAGARQIFLNGEAHRSVPPLTIGRLSTNEGVHCCSNNNSRGDAQKIAALLTSSCDSSCSCTRLWFKEYHTGQDFLSALQVSASAFQSL